MPGTPRSCGTVVLYRPIFHLCRVQRDNDGRFVVCEFSYHDKLFHICGVYAPNRDPDRGDFFHFVIDSVDPLVPTVICGDFNAVFDCAIDRGGPGTQNACRNDSVALFSLFRECCILDVWRTLHATDPGFTWRSPDCALSSQIDYFGCPYSWASSVLSCDIYPCPWSDNCALLFCFSLPDSIPKGPGRWHLNTSVLSDPDFHLLITNFWSGWKNRKSSFDSLRSWWDLGKIKFKSLPVRFCNQKSIERNMLRTLLTNLSQHLKFQIDRGVTSCIEVLSECIVSNC